MRESTTERNEAEHVAVFTRSRVKLYCIMRTRTRMRRPPRVISLKWRSRNHEMCFNVCHTHRQTDRQMRPPRVISLKWHSRNHEMCFNVCRIHRQTDRQRQISIIHSHRCRRFWHANLRLRSAIRRHHPPQRAVLSQICCFGERKVVLFQILLDGAEPRDAGTT